MVKDRWAKNLIKRRNIVNKNFHRILDKTSILEEFKEDEVPQYTAEVSPSTIGISYSKITSTIGAYKLEQYRNKFHTITITKDDHVPIDYIIDAYTDMTTNFIEREEGYSEDDGI